MFPTFLIVNDESVTREYHWELQATQMGVSCQGTTCPQLPFQKRQPIQEQSTKDCANYQPEHVCQFPKQEHIIKSLISNC